MSRMHTKLCEQVLTSYKIRAELSLLIDLLKAMRETASIATDTRQKHADLVVLQKFMVEEAMKVAKSNQIEHLLFRENFSKHLANLAEQGEYVFSRVAISHPLSSLVAQKGYQLDSLILGNELRYATERAAIRWLEEHFRTGEAVYLAHGRLFIPTTDVPALWTNQVNALVRCD